MAADFEKVIVMVELDKALRLLMAENNHRSREAGKVTGINPDSLSKYANGALPISMKTAIKISNGYKIKLSEFIALGEDDK